MSIVILTSTAPRHTYFASEIASHYRVDTVLLEPKTFDPRTAARNSEDEQVLSSWFDEVSEVEWSFFGQTERELQINETKVVTLRAGGGNDPEVVEYLNKLKPSHLLVFGSSILKSAVLSSCTQAALNLHLGLSPFYRGSATNFWALHDGRPGYVGATIHVLDSGIDSGPIVCRGRPIISAEDSAHSIGCKAIQVGIQLMLETVRKSLIGPLESAPQTEKTIRMCRRSDFNANSVRTLLTAMKNGMLSDFLAQGAPGPVPTVAVERKAT